MAQISDNEIEKDLNMLNNAHSWGQEQDREALFQKIDNNSNIYIDFVKRKIQFPDNDSLLLNEEFMYHYQTNICLLTAIDSDESNTILKDYYNRFKLMYDERSALMERIYQVDWKNYNTDKIRSLRFAENIMLNQFVTLMTNLGHKKDKTIITDCLNRITDETPSIKLAVFEYLSNAAIGDKSVIQKLTVIYHDQNSDLCHDIGLKNLIKTIGGDVDNNDNLPPCINVN